jgi:hypothetical protein
VPDSYVSRREFLKFVGVGIGFIALGGPGSVVQMLLQKDRRSFAQSTSTGPSWSLGPTLSSVAIDATLLPSGKIWYISGSGYCSARQPPIGPYSSGIIDPTSGAETSLPLSDDLWCSMHSHLPNGNILVEGGTLLYDSSPDSCNGKWHGLKSAYELDVSTESLTPVSPMAHGRWYPTNVALPDGKVFVVNGLDEYGTYNKLVEVYDPNSKSWAISYAPNTSDTYCVGAGSEATCPGAGSPCYGGPNQGVAPQTGYYPRAHLMPSGLVFITGPLKQLRTWNPATGAWLLLGPYEPARSYGTSFLLPLQNTATEKGKVLVVCGSPDSGDYAVTTAHILDFNASNNNKPVVRVTSPIAVRRKHACPVILPDGKCVIFGGNEQGTKNFPVKVPEMFNPITETWQSLPAASVDRVYHSVALLLMDGRVWTAGGTPQNCIGELRTEIFSPSYVFESRPTITGTPIVGGYGGEITLSTPDHADISSVSLLRLMSVTHHYDPNQRLVWLQIKTLSQTALLFLLQLMLILHRRDLI